MFLYLYEIRSKKNHAWIILLGVTMELFKELLDYAEYLNQNPFHQNLGVSLEEYGSLEKKTIRETYFSVDPENKIPFSEEMDDLIRLHYLIINIDLHPLHI